MLYWSIVHGFDKKHASTLSPSGPARFQVPPIEHARAGSAVPGGPRVEGSASGPAQVPPAPIW